MTKLLAYLIAIWQLYRRQLLLLLFIICGLAAIIDWPDYQWRLKESSESTSLPPAMDSGMLGSADRLGRRYSSLVELNATQKAVGFVPVGFFGKNWPAKVTEVLSAVDGIEFLRSNGIRHSYEGFEGYHMKVVRLVADNNEETLIVYRSDFKR